MRSRMMIVIALVMGLIVGCQPADKTEHENPFIGHWQGVSGATEAQSITIYQANQHFFIELVDGSRTPEVVLNYPLRYDPEAERMIIPFSDKPAVLSLSKRGQKKRALMIDGDENFRYQRQAP